MVLHINYIKKSSILAFCQEYLQAFYEVTDNILENSTINYVNFCKSVYLYSENQL